MHAVEALLARVAHAYPPTAFASSFGAEDLVVLDLFARARLPIRVFTLDTGRLPQETHDLIDRSRTHYRIAIHVYTPQTDAVQSFIREHGTNGFYDGIELRQQCCAMLPALLTGFALAFARAIGEYGSVIFIAGNLPMVSEITPLIIITKLEQYDYVGATAVASVMLLVSFALLLVINGLQAWTSRRTGRTR